MPAACQIVQMALDDTIVGAAAGQPNPILSHMRDLALLECAVPGASGKDGSLQEVGGLAVSGALVCNLPVGMLERQPLEVHPFDVLAVVRRRRPVEAGAKASARLPGTSPSLRLAWASSSGCPSSCPDTIRPGQSRASGKFSR